MHAREKQFLSHAAIYLLARGLPGVLAFLAIPLFSRLLAPADYGRYAVVIGAVCLINALLFQWLRLALVRYLSAYSQDARGLKSTLMSATLTIVAALGVIGIVASLLPVGREWAGVIAACWVVT